MVAKKDTEFNVDGKSLFLSAGDLKALSNNKDVTKLIKNLKEMKHLYEMRLLTLQKEQKLMHTMMTSEKEVTKNYEHRLTVVKAIRERIEGMMKYEVGTKVGGVKGAWSKALANAPGPAPAGGAAPAASGGGFMGMIGEGAKAGLVAAVTIKLIDAIEKGIQQSKHVQLIESSLAKAMGLLIDLILLPFLPLLVFGIIALYKAVIAVGAAWKSAVDWIKGLFTDPLGTLTDLFTRILPAIAKFLFNDLPMAILGGMAAVLAGILHWLTTLGDQIGQGLADAIWKPLIPFYVQFKLWWAGLLSFDWLKDPWGTIKNVFLAFFGFVWLVSPFKILYDVITAFFDFKWIGTDPFSQIRDDFTSFFTWLKGVTDKLNPTTSASNFTAGMLGPVGEALHLAGVFDTGGVVPGTGPQLAVVHGGETITPAGQSAGHTFNFYGYQDDQFISKVRDVLRKDGARLNL